MTETTERNSVVDQDSVSPLPSSLYKSFLKLHFNGNLESAFQAFVSNKNIRYSQLAFVGAFLVFLCYGPLDFILLKPDPTKVWHLRYWVGAPILLFLCGLAFTPLIKRFQQIILLSGVVSMGSVMLAMMFMVNPIAAQIYFCAFLILMMSGLTVLRMQFPYAVLSGLLLIIFFLVASSLFVSFSPAVILDAVLVMSASFVCCLATYFTERSARKDFIQKYLLDVKQAELQKINQELKHLVDIDGLTGVANRRHFDESLAAEWRRASRDHYNIGLLMIDLDFFKYYNDHYGHQQGDECLKRVAQLLCQFGQRPGDLAARYGGEEFAIILPKASTEQAVSMGHSICKAVAELNLEHAFSPVARYVTVSVGAASLAAFAEHSVTQLILQADQALYRAKGAGRNTCSGDAPIAPNDNVVGGGFTGNSLN